MGLQGWDIEGGSRSGVDMASCPPSAFGDPQRKTKGRTTAMAVNKQGTGTGAGTRQAAKRRGKKELSLSIKRQPGQPGIGRRAWECVGE